MVGKYGRVRLGLTLAGVMVVAFLGGLAAREGTHEVQNVVLDGRLGAVHVNLQTSDGQCDGKYACTDMGPHYVPESFWRGASVASVAQFVATAGLVVWLAPKAWQLALGWAPRSKARVATGALLGAMVVAAFSLLAHEMGHVVQESATGGVATGAHFDLLMHSDGPCGGKMACVDWGALGQHASVRPFWDTHAAVYTAQYVVTLAMALLVLPSACGLAWKETRQVDAKVSTAMLVRALRADRMA